MIPFVTASLRVVMVPGAFVRADQDDRTCILVGREPAWRLTPLAYAWLFRAADSRCSTLPRDHPDAIAIAAALDVVYDELLKVCRPADVRTWAPEMPSLFPPPKIPPDEAWEPLRTDVAGELPTETKDEDGETVRPWRPAPPAVTTPKPKKKETKAKADVGELF